MDNNRRPVLDGIKPGDEIFVPPSSMAAPSLHPVIRVTKTQAVCELDIRFQIESGRRIGVSSFSTITGSIATDADRAKMQMRSRILAARRAIEQMKITPANIDAVEALLKSIEPTKEI